MKMLFFGLCCFVAAGTTISLFTADAACNEEILNSFVTIEGTVKTTEPETGKVFTPVGQTLIFQRVDCRKCLQVVVTDEKGDYQLRLGEGKYRLLVPDDISKGGSYLAPDQPKIVNAKEKTVRNTFDIKLIRKRNPVDTVLSSIE